MNHTGIHASSCNIFFSAKRDRGRFLEQMRLLGLIRFFMIIKSRAHSPLRIEEGRTQTDLVSEDASYWF